MIKRFIFIFLSLQLLISFAHAQYKVPQWLINLYIPDSSKLAPTKDMPHMFAPKSVNIIFFRQLNDSASYCIYTANNGVCLLHYLATQKYRKPYSEIQFADKCEEDVSSISFTSTYFHLDSLSNIIISIRTTATATDQCVTNDGQFKRFKAGYTRKNAAMTKDVTVKEIKISDAGLIEEHNISK